MRPTFEKVNVSDTPGSTQLTNVKPGHLPEKLERGKATESGVM